MFTQQKNLVNSVNLIDEEPISNIHGGNRNVLPYCNWVTHVPVNENIHKYTNGIHKISKAYAKTRVSISGSYCICIVQVAGILKSCLLYTSRCV